MIKDPANLVDRFLFDDPWKKLSLDLDAFMHRLKAQAGVVED